MATREFKAGDVLLAEGSVPECAYRIVQGSVELSRDLDGSPMPTSVLDRGALVGADELLDGKAMSDTAQALGDLVVEEVSADHAARLLGRPRAKPKAERIRKQPETRESSQRGGHPASRALVALSSHAAGEYAAEDPALSVLKPGLLRRILKPEFADVYDRIEVRVASLGGEGGEQATQHLIGEINQRRGLRARTMNAKVMLDIGADPVQSVHEIKKASARWLIDNGGDVILWGEVAPDGRLMHLRFFIRDDAPIDQFRMGDGWSLLVLPYPLDGAAAHRLHAALLACVRTKEAGKLLTVRRDLDVLLADAREQLIGETAGMSPVERAEDRATMARVFAGATRFKRRADDARTAINLLDSALDTFTPGETPIEWALANRDRAILGQFVAERTNDTDALRGSIADIDAALSVLNVNIFANDWALLNDRLGLALYRLDFDNGDTETLERALKAFEDALSVYDRRASPVEWAEAMAHFGQVALVIGREQRNSSTLLRAVNACNEVVSVRDRNKMPLHWASAQNNLGSALFLYGRVTGDSDALRGAREAFRTAHAIYVEKGAERLGRVAAKNLQHVDKALDRRPRVAAPSPPALPWEPKENEPPPLPWELEQRPAPKPRADDEIWVDERLR